MCIPLGTGGARRRGEGVWGRLGAARLTPPGLPSEGFPGVLGLEVKAIRGPGEALRGGRDPPPRQLHCRKSGPGGKFRSGPKQDAVGSPGTPSPGDLPWSHTLIPGPRLPRNGASTKKRAPWRTRPWVVHPGQLGSPRGQ